jgi:hypothetical protein
MIELITTVSLSFSAFYGMPVVIPDRTVSEEKSVTQNEVVLPMTLEDHINEYFKDTPILAKIARCESTYRHFKPDGKILRGETNPLDVGVMQINEGYHGERATKLGFDLHTLDGNLSYAKWLYSKEGTVPWNSSKKCWKSKIDHIADRNNLGA